MTDRVRYVPIEPEPDALTSYRVYAGQRELGEVHRDRWEGEWSAVAPSGTRIASNLMSRKGAVHALRHHRTGGTA